MTGIFIKNANGNLFEKRPEHCPLCNESLKTAVKIQPYELDQYNVDPSDPYLYSVIEIIDTKNNKRVGWKCSQCMCNWYDNKDTA